jgi:signal transduction histidine kinase
MSPDTIRISKKPATGKLNHEKQPKAIRKHRVTFQPIPFSEITETDDKHPVWQVRFDLTTDASVSLGLEINGEVVFGRGPGGPEHLDLIPYGAHDYGVSRRHLILRPTHSRLFVLDLDSTNGTYWNGVNIREMDGPCTLQSGDTLTLGGLEMAITIIKRPTDTGQLRQKADLGDALAQIAKAINSQVNLDEVLRQALETAMELTSAGEMSIWLVDEESEELFLEAERGIQDEKIKLMRMAVDNSLVGQVIRTGVSLRDSREPSGDKIKVKTGYLVEAVLYVPLMLEDKAIGVLGATHGEMGKTFGERDERLLEAIADHAAIAVHNARLFEALRRTQSRLIQVARLSALGEMAAIVAHQINNPLTTILADAEILLQDLSTKHVNYASARAIHMAGQRAKSVVDRLLYMAHPAAEMQPVQVNDTIEATLELVSNQLTMGGHEVKVHYSPDLPRIDALTGQLEDVWLNLLINARDALRETREGLIVIRSGLSKDGEAVEVTVSDNGSGIAEENLKHVFSPDFTTKPRGVGTGLGLYICKQIVGQHKGQITITSQESKGTRVSVSLPIKAEAARSEEAKPSEADDRKPVEHESAGSPAGSD